MPTPIKDQFVAVIHQRQEAICAELSALDGTPFAETSWTREAGGGGRSRILEGGAVFERAGVNVSVVHGALQPEAARAMSTTHDLELGEGESDFFAAGISLVIHPVNPFVPTTHANYRYMEVAAAGTRPKAWWFGGGADLTPYYLFDEDAISFHRTYKGICDRFDPDYYPRFKRWCDEYFTLPHRQEARGIGGIFFDDLRGDAALGFASACAEGLLAAYLPIVQRRQQHPFEEAHKRWQELRRGRYVEFNLLFDQGTSFGLRSGGRTESILMSLPPAVRWAYEGTPEAGSEEARLMDVVSGPPRAWV